MVKSDQFIISALVVFIIIHILVWAIGLYTHKLSHLFSFLNAGAAVLLIGYRAINELRIQQHYIEPREILVLGFELAVFVVSLYNILYHPTANSIKMVHYVVFGIHFAILAAFLIFMLSFKITKLF